MDLMKTLFTDTEKKINKKIITLYGSKTNTIHRFVRNLKKKKKIPN